MLGFKIIQTRVASDCGLSRLKSIFTSGQNYHNYEQIVSGAKNKILGNIPSEFIRIIAKLHPENKGKLIKDMQLSFGNLAGSLKKIENVEIDYIKNLSGRDEEITFLLKNLFSNLKINGISPKSTQIIEESGIKLANDIEKFLQMKCNANIEYLGHGQFGNAYKLSITKDSGEKILHDRVIKIFKNSDNNAELLLTKEQKIQELLNKYSDDDLFEIYKNIPTKKSSIKIKVSEENRKRIFLDVLNNNRREYANKNFDNIKAQFSKQCQELSDIHGLYAEANSTFRLKHILGHKISKTDAVDTDMFDLDIGYSITQFADKELPQITSKINYKDLGLYLGDSKPENFVSGRMIDFGGIYGDNIVQISDNTVLTYYKKIVNRTNIQERQDLINRYIGLIKNPKTPERDKIIQALDIISPRFKTMHQLGLV